MQTLPHPSRQLARLAGRRLDQPHTLQGVHDRAVSPSDVHALNIGEEQQVVACRSPRVEPQFTAQDQAQPGPGPLRMAHRIDAIDPDLTRRRSQQRGAHPHRRRLTGTVGPQQTMDLPRPDVQGHILHGDEGFVLFPEGANQVGGTQQRILIKQYHRAPPLSKDHNQ